MTDVKDIKYNQNDYFKNYYVSKKEKFTEKIICTECGWEYSYSCKTNHLKSKIHQKLKAIREKQISDI